MPVDAEREHSAPPAGPAPTLENVHAIVTHLAVVAEVTRTAVDRLERSHDERELQHTLRERANTARERALAAIAAKLSDAALRIGLARAIGAAVPSGVILVLVIVFSLLGGAATQVALAAYAR